MSKKPVLGQGLDALFGIDNEMENKTSLENDGLSNISLKRLKPNPKQPRHRFDSETLNELAESIRQQGIVQPILAEKKSNNEYYIIAGERRWRAAKIAGLEEVPVIIREFSEEQKLEIALVENIQRDNLTPLEEATAYAGLMDGLGLSQQEVADKVGKNRSTVANSIRLLRLSPAIKEALDTGKITPGHARALLSVSDEIKRENLFSHIINNSLSVRETEASAIKFNIKEEIPEKKEPDTGKTKNKDPDLVQIEGKIIETLGTKVVLKGTLDRGKIEISWYNAEDLDRIYDILIGSK